MGAGIGITGVHRSGKSTLMNALAKQTGMLPAPTQVGDVFKDLGMRADAKLPFHDRMTVQDEILRRQRAIYTEARSAALGGFITDRTPMDLIGYTMADLSAGGDLGEENVARLTRYLDDCYELANEFFGHIVVVQPGIKLVPCEFKGNTCPAYMEHLHMVLMGAVMDARCKIQRIIIPRNMTALAPRVNHLTETIAETSSAFGNRMSALHSFH